MFGGQILAARVFDDVDIGTTRSDGSGTHLCAFGFSGQSDRVCREPCSFCSRVSVTQVVATKVGLEAENDPIIAP